MWSYYGSKANVVDLYPRPLFNKIIEPFAGSARYSLKYFENEIILVDKWPVIIDIWKFLQECSPKDILSLPNVPAGKTLDDYDFDCQSAKKLMGFIVQYGVSTPGLTPSPMKLKYRPNFIEFSKRRIANDLYKIKHWKFQCSDYSFIENQNATWFVDPPYQHGGHKYAMSSLKINFDHLSKWCRSLSGQVMVCENTKADWMEFNPVGIQHGSKAKTTEAIWTNYHTHFNNKQQSLF